MSTRIRNGSAVGQELVIARIEQTSIIYALVVVGGEIDEKKLSVIIGWTGDNDPNVPRRMVASVCGTEVTHAPDASSRIPIRANLIPPPP